MSRSVPTTAEPPAQQSEEIDEAARRLAQMLRSTEVGAASYPTVEEARAALVGQTDDWGGVLCGTASQLESVDHWAGIATVDISTAEYSEYPLDQQLAVAAALCPDRFQEIAVAVSAGVEVQIPYGHEPVSEDEALERLLAFDALVQ